MNLQAERAPEEPPHDDEWPNTTDNYILHALILGPLLLFVLFAVGVIGTAIWDAVWGLL